MSSSNGTNSTASNRTSIFETFNNSSTFDMDAEDFVVNHNVKPVKSVVRRTFDNQPEPAPEVEGFEETLGQETDDVECIEEEEENQDYTLFMSCSPGRISTEEEESDEQLIFHRQVEKNAAPKKKKNKPKSPEKHKVQKQPKQPVKEPKKQQRQKRQEEEEEEDEEEEQAQNVREVKKQHRKQVQEDEDYDSNEHQSGKESKKQEQQALKEPKKPLSAYALFYRDTQSAIKSQNAKATFGEVSKIVATMWDNLDKEHRTEYDNQAEADKEMYLQEKAQYRQACKLQQKKLEAQKKEKTSQPRPYVAHHRPSWSKSSVEQENDDSRSSRESQDPVAETVVKTTVLSLCNRSNCPNRAVEDARWKKDYCSTECVISHCRDVFTAWVNTRQTTWKADA